MPPGTSIEDYLNIPETKCHITCDQDNGPFSPMRGGSGNNIYLIRAPTKLSFNTALLLSAACCIPAILSMIFMWSKIVEVNSRGKQEENEATKPIEGTRATVGGMNRVNALVRELLLVVEVPVFAAAILAILILGELNFWSEQVYYMTEPLASVGTFFFPFFLFFQTSHNIISALSNGSPTNLDPRPVGTHSRHRPGCLGLDLCSGRQKVQGTRRASGRGH